MTTKNRDESRDDESQSTERTEKLSLKIKRARTKLSASVATGLGGAGGCCFNQSKQATDPYCYGTHNARG